MWMMETYLRPDDGPQLWQVRAGADDQYEDRFLESDQVDIDFKWDYVLDGVESLEELRTRYRLEIPDYNGHSAN